MAAFESLRNQCTPKQREVRERAFEQARRFIEEHPNAEGPISQSYPQPLDKEDSTRRVDIEVRTGKAFTQ